MQTTADLDIDLEAIEQEDQLTLMSALVASPPPSTGCGS